MQLAARLRQRRQVADRAAALLQSRARIVLGPKLAARLTSMGAVQPTGFVPGMAVHYLVMPGQHSNLATVL